MEKLLERFDKLLGFWCVLVTGAMTAAVITLVFSRYVLGITFIWAEESVSVLFFATTYFGAALGVRCDEHIRIDYFTAKMPPSFERPVKAMQIAVVIFLQIFLLKVGLNWIAKVGGTLTPGLRVPVKFIYAMFPINAVIVTLYESVRLFSLFSGKKDGGSPACAVTGAAGNEM
jgi:TRAP-type C4-dicarboxylate transport system permease small subunit